MRNEPRRTDHPLRALTAMLASGLAIGLLLPFAVDPFVAWVPGRRGLFSLLCVIAGLSVGGVGHLVIRSIALRRLAAVAAQVRAQASGRGAPAVAIPVAPSDALGEIVSSVSASVANLREVAATAQRTAGAMDDAFAGLSARITPLLRSVGESRAVADDVGGQVASLGSGAQEVAGRVRQVAAHMEENAATILEQEASIQEIDGQADEVASAIAETISSVGELSASIRQVAEGSASMSAAATATLDLVDQMTKGVEQIRAMVGEAGSFSANVVGEAKTGVALVARVIEAMGNIDDRERESSATLDELRRASESIGEIVHAMRSIAGQTGLLALNASIIAAQAGEEGRAFAVVATSIRTLSGKADASTREAGEILEGIREGIERSFAAAAQSREETARGVNLSAEAGDALEKIVAMISQERERVSAIGEVAARQAEHNRLITEAMAQVSSMTGQVAGATEEESRGIGLILGTTGRLGEIAGLVKRALAEQRKTSRQLAEATEAVSRLVAGLAEAQEAQASTARRAADLVGRSRAAAAGQAEEIRAVESDVATARGALETLKASVRGLGV